MVTNELKQELLTRFPSCYKTFLVDCIYKDESYVKGLFARPQVAKAFNNVIDAYFSAIEEFYKSQPNGSYMQELSFVINNSKLQNALGKYNSVVGDKSLIRFLQVYSYCVQELSGILYEGNKIRKGILESFFSQTARNSTQMFRRVEKDVAEGNYWWLKNTATTLRRQFHDNFAFVNTRRFKFMCSKYLERNFEDEDIKREFTETVNGGQKLIEELDKKMAERYNAIPYYCWHEVVDGKRQSFISENPPQKGVYAYVAYHTKINSKSQDKECKFY